VHDTTQVAPALRERGGEARKVAMQGTEPCERLAEPRAVAFETFARARDQELQVVARVGVERRQHLVLIDVGQRVGQRYAGALGDAWTVARIDLDEHVFESGPRPQQSGGVAAHERAVTWIDVEADHRSSLLEVDRGDLTDLDARDAHALPLPRRDSLGARQLGVDAERLPLEERDPDARLVGEDVASNTQPERSGADESYDVAQVSP